MKKEITEFKIDNHCNKWHIDKKYYYQEIGNLVDIVYKTIELSRLDCLYKFWKTKEIFDHNLEMMVCSHYENIYKFYLEHKDTIDLDARDKLSELGNELLDNGKCISIDCGKFVNIRYFFDYPTLYPRENAVYGTDLSFLDISDKTISQHFKCIYFVGTYFENVIFEDCSFSSCIFIGCRLDVTFINCDLDGATFYKNNYINDYIFIRNKRNPTIIDDE